MSDERLADLVAQAIYPRDIPCPVCFAPIGAPCNAPTNNGRRDVAWYHLKREERDR